MKVVPFIANSAAEAVAQIQQQLGPDAVVLNVRKLPGEGLSGLWRKSRIEVIACLPDPPADPAQGGESVTELRRELEILKQQIQPPTTSSAASPMTHDPAPAVADWAALAFRNHGSPRDYGGWRSGDILENLGLLPVYAQRLVAKLQTEHGSRPPSDLAEEMLWLQKTLKQAWRPLPSDRTSRAHVFMGPPGSGKTTCLCKWLTRAVLLDGCSARVWRLDGRTANVAQILDVYCEVLGVELERAPSSEPIREDLLFIDWPGSAFNDPAEKEELRQQLQAYGEAEVHLLLNAAYETRLLLAQLHGYMDLPITDLSFSHLDEETQWGKLWNFVLGTNFSFRFLSGGQNIPGSFLDASADLLIKQQFAW